MNYYLTLNLTKLPYVTEKRVEIDGELQQCVVIPINAGQVKRSAKGEPLLGIRMIEIEPNAALQTHQVVFQIRDPEKKVRLCRHELYAGFARLYSDEIKKNASENNMTDFLATGVICLDDIAPDDIIKEPRTGKRYVKVTFKKTPVLDAFKNSHELIVKKENGDIRVGLFREWPTEGYTYTVSETASNNDDTAIENTLKPVETPQKIDGIKF